MRCRAADADAETVRVVVAAAPHEGVTVAGKKLHVVPAGSPEQAKETAELKPPAGVTEIAVVPLVPAVAVNDAGDAETEKPGAGRLTVYVALDTAL